MNRQLKFRIWDKQNKIFIHEWDASHKRLAISLVGLVYHGGYDDVLPENDYVVQQYTGLKDKNGKEIYEGDIILGEFYDTEYHHSVTIKHEVVFNNGAYNIASSNWHKPSLEIIGNIFENSELLKQ
jgi:uncharacterized phage protein (TIGR01671 family)